jgi:glycylpeptide N-tetradecanoyltransferase
VTTSKKLVAFISGIPISLRVRQNTLCASEINFLCVHKKLRDKRLAPVLIKEITRRCYLDEIWQAIYTGGKLLPTPVSTCRYFHRPLEWQMLYDVGFAQCPSNSKPAYQVAKYALPTKTLTPNLRAMETKDIDAVHELLSQYLNKFDIAQIFTKEEVAHWFLQGSLDEQVVWSYVVEVFYSSSTWLVSIRLLYFRTPPRSLQTSSLFTLWNLPFSATNSTATFVLRTCSTTQRMLRYRSSRTLRSSRSVCNCSSMTHSS